MAKRGTSPDQILARLSALRQAPSSPEFAAELKRALGHSSVALVARGAELASRYNRSELAGELCEAFHRFRRGVGGAQDKQCIVATAIVRALVDLVVTTAAAEDVYLAGIVTRSGRSPPSAENDDAAELRAASAFGLVNARHPDAVLRCADLLADSDPVPQIGAARALAASGSTAAPLLLRLRLRIGEAVPDVLAECATQLMVLDPGPNLDVVAGLLRHADESVRAAAALAIGSSRQPGALDLLKRAFAAEREPDVASAVLVAAAGTRSAEAADWLVGLVATDAKMGPAAVEALGPYRLDESVKRRVAEAAAAHGGAAAEAYRRAFG